MSEELNYYEVLGLTPGASQEEIQRAYIRMAREYHPDHNQAQDDRKMIELNSIYETLTNPERKREYDARFAPEQTYDFTKNRAQEPEVKKKKTPAKRQGNAISSSAIKRIIGTVIVICLCYFIFTVAVKILNLYMDLPGWILNVVP